MNSADADQAAAIFDPLRPRLSRVAYRMLGSVADAEDVVQEAFIRWLRTDRDSVREPEAFLRRTVTRLCLDQLKSARRRHETYIGPWLPEPVLDEEDDIEDVTLPLLLALERLSPLERAAFLLHDVFGAAFEEVAVTIGRDAAACRQLASRARGHVREARPRFTVEKQRGLAIAKAFFEASRSGDMGALGAMLASDVEMYSDGGGYQLARAADDITFLDIVDAVEGDKPLFDCQEVRGRCAVFNDCAPGWATTGTCAIHAVMLQAENAMRQALSVQSLGAVSERFNRKAPDEFRTDVRNWIDEKASGRTTRSGRPPSTSPT